MTTLLPTSPPTRRTPERILAVALEHFNRYGEPQVSTHQLAAALRISSGNLHYHFRSKELLIVALFERYATALHAALARPDDLRDWIAGLFDVHWRYRFVLRDLATLLTRNLALEQQLPALLQAQEQALADRLAGCTPHGAAVAAALHLALVHWIGQAYLQAPRSALDDAGAGAARAGLLQHVDGLLAAAG